MKIYISADGEGVTGVVTPGEMYPGKPGYEFACRMITLDVNAAIKGAFQGGASEVLLNDAHWNMDNTEFMSTVEANIASLLPGAVRKSPRVVAVSAENPVEAWKALFASQTLGVSASDDIYG